MSPQSNDGLRGDLKELLGALQDNRAAIAQQLAELDRKVDEVPNKIEQMRREQAAQMQQLRIDFERLFVAKAEYEPRHAAVLSKIAEYDALVRESKKTTEDWIEMKGRVKTLERKVEEDKGKMSRLLPWIALGISAVTALISVLQHIHFS